MGAALGAAALALGFLCWAYLKDTHNAYLRNQDR